MSDQVPGRSMVYTAADPKSAWPRAESPKFPSFFDFPPAKRVLSTRSSKSPEIYPIKKVFFPKRVQLYKKKKTDRHWLPAPPTPKRSKKSILIFVIFFRLLCQAPRCGLEVSNGHRSEVNIKRVMTQNQQGGS